MERIVEEPASLAVVTSPYMISRYTEFLSYIRFKRTSSACASEGPSTIANTIFLRAPIFSSLPECECYLCIVRLLVKLLILFGEHDVPEIEVAEIVVLFDVCHANVALVRICSSEGNESSIQRFQGTQIMRGEDQLSLPPL